MTIREADYQDIPAIIEIGKLAIGESKLSEICTVDERRAFGLLYQCITNHAEPAPYANAVFVSEGEDGINGLIIGTIQPAYEVTNINVVTHMLWYVAPGASARAGMKLLDALHGWADRLDGPVIKRHLVHDMIVDPEKTAKLFKRRGYRLTGYLFEKE